MRDAFIDVTLEIPVRDIHDLDSRDASRAVLERMRNEADRQCAAAGATLRTDRAPELEFRRAMHPLLGDFVLVASRWPVVVREGHELDRPA